MIPTPTRSPAMGTRNPAMEHLHMAIRNPAMDITSEFWILFNVLVCWVSKRKGVKKNHISKPFTHLYKLLIGNIKYISYECYLIFNKGSPTTLHLLLNPR